MPVAGKKSWIPTFVGMTKEEWEGRGRKTGRMKTGKTLTFFLF